MTKRIPEPLAASYVLEPCYEVDGATKPCVRTDRRSEYTSIGYI